MDPDKIKEIVKKSYDSIIEECGSFSESPEKLCLSDELTPKDPCGGQDPGLSFESLAAIASIQEGEIVLNLGSGVGFECFLAADNAGKNGKVIGVDASADMVEKARQNAFAKGYSNVEFRCGKLESLPVKDNSIDVVISNCIINLVPDKDKVFKEAFRVLKNGGRIVVSDTVLVKALPDFIFNSMGMYGGGVASGSGITDYVESIKRAGFTEVEVVEETSFPTDCIKNDPTLQKVIHSVGISPETIIEMLNAAASIKVKGIKP